jgi:hypothetical protein
MMYRTWISRNSPGDCVLQPNRSTCGAVAEPLAPPVASVVVADPDAADAKD